ncbi:radical SAM/SPASM domain-containing protein [Streptomyces lunaelactis]|uniref:radical SAM/SPASM domain-containing protein n=1 Tax=Streptomyces lunaelactis TaxID=1535768 RepID=UPI001584D229|nr:radical SAM protein [Streptomyces lunaelactis]NUK21940.1 radical SAM protein [Streptomyces lunaelactis]
MNLSTKQRHTIEGLYRSLDVEDHDTAVSVIVKTRGETCDIDCLYCYEKRKEAPGGARVSAAQIKQLATVFKGRKLALELHGGEPLTAGREHIAEILTELARLPQVVRVSLQTNGVLLDEQWLDLFDELCPGLSIGISLDGDARGSAWRVGYDGKPVYPRVARSLRLLGERGRSVGVIAAVTPAVLDRAEEVLEHLAGFGSVNAISFVPCFDVTIRRSTALPGRRRSASRQLQKAALDASGGPAWAIHPDEYAQFVLAATAHWISAGHFARIKLEPAVSTIRRLRGLMTPFCHFSDLKCDHVFTLYPDGRLGSCDELPWPQARLTQLESTGDEHEVVHAQQDSLLLNQGKALMDKCAMCDYRTTCGGGCIATRWRQGPLDGHDAYCDYRMRMIDGVAALLAQPAHPQGAWCQSLRWRPRTPNSMRDVHAFQARWDSPGPVHDRVRLRTSEHGNINTVGLAGIHEADDLHPAHPLWRAAIESGVWPLVDTLTRTWGLVTYDSCEGHPYTETDRPPTGLRVGLLPRDRQEYARTAGALCRATTSATAAMPPGIEVHVSRSDLTCETTGTTTPVLDLSLDPAPGHSWEDYFARRDEATAVLTAALDAERPNSTTCTCPLPAPQAQAKPVEVFP